MFRSCYRGHVLTRISRTSRHHAQVCCRDATARSQLPALDIAHVRLRQLSDPSGLDHIDHIPALARALGRIGLHQTCRGENFEVSIQAGPADIDSRLQSPHRRRAERRQVAQDNYPGAVAHKTDGHLNFGRQVWANQARHESILPDVIRNLCSFCTTLLISNRVATGPKLCMA